MGRALLWASLLMMLVFGALEHFDSPPPPLLMDAMVHISATDESLPHLVLVPAEKPQIAQASPYLIDASTVVQVRCRDGGSGSAVYLGSGRYVTAAHVVTDEKTHAPIKCWIFGQLITIEQFDILRDFAIIHAAHYPPYRAPISCDRLKEGETYFATGYAEGNPWPVTTRLHGAGYREPDGEMAGSADVNGSLVAGMSGGSIADGDGFTHAINDWRDDDGVPSGGVVELADTPLCMGKK